MLMLPLVDLDLRKRLEEKTCDGPISCAWRAARRADARGRRDPPRRRRAHHGVFGELRCSRRGSPSWIGSGAAGSEQRRSSTADRRSGARGGSAPPRRPASAGAPPSHPPARTSAVSNRIRAGSACEAPPSFFSFSSPRRTRLVPRRAPGPSARFSVCAGGPALYIVAPPNARTGAWPVGARVHRSNLLDLCRPWSCLAAAECMPAAAGADRVTP